MNEQDFEQRLQKQINALPKEQMPERDLWAGIEIALEKAATPSYVPSNINDTASTRGTRVPWLAIAASVVIVGLLGWFGGQTQFNRTSHSQLAMQISEQHQQYKDALLVNLAGQSTATDNWQEQLADLDEAAAAVKKALQQEPNNNALLKMLQSIHRQQIDLIERVHSPQWTNI
jgi:hypothetical protein